MIKQIIALAKNIEKSWQDEEFDKSVFPEISFEELEKFHHDTELGDFETQMAQWIFHNELPKQVNVFNDFGQPPVTLFNNGKFAIDVYFWMHIDTSIHSHSFSGAFKVLYGRSVHEIYTAKPTKIYAPDVMKTNITCRSVELLLSGQTHRIKSGNQFNHRVIHIDAPTVTLCIRTVDDVKGSQWHHFPNGLAIEKKEISQKVYKSLYYYEYLLLRNSEEASKFLDGLVKSWSISISMNLYEQLANDSMGIVVEAVEAIFAAILEAHGETEWFKIYLDFYKNMENHIEIDGHESADRFLEYAINSNYSHEMAKDMLEKIQGQPLSELQTLQLSSLI